MNLYLISGFLGSGKTTLLNNMLARFRDKKNAVVINDFGAVNVDAGLEEQSVRDVFPITDGSVFCSCKSDKFADTLIKLSAMQEDNVIVETSGLANPFILPDCLSLVDKNCAAPYRFMGNICTADATTIEKAIISCNAAVMQIACADLILLNKCDLCAESDIFRAQTLIRQINKTAEIVRSSYSDIDKINLDKIEIFAKDKKLPLYIEDVTLQKAALIISKLDSVRRLDEMCAKISVFAQRIKGFVEIDGKKYHYEFINGRGKLSLCDCKQTRLVVLTALKVDLKKLLTEVVSEYEFARYEKS